jgi:bifunctional non-homologous end joining protein LigD
MVAHLYGVRLLEADDEHGHRLGLVTQHDGVRWDDVRILARLVAPWAGGGAEVLATSQEQGLEGVVAKRLASTYQPGRRTRDWIKTKNLHIQEVVVGGWSPGQGRRAGSVGSLLIGVPDPPGGAGLAQGTGLRYIGHVGTGFTAATLADLAGRLAELEQSGSPFTAGAGVPREHARGARWARPVLVGDVTYSEWTPEGVLRHPSWRGLRTDKRPEEVRRESR